MNSQTEINVLFNSPEDSYVIHYSFIEADGINSHLNKIISIHAKNLNSSDSREFSIEKTASKNDIPIEDLQDWFDDLELTILDEFNSFLKEKSKCIFIYYCEEDGQGLILDEIKRIFDARNKSYAKKTFKIIPTSNRKSIPFIFRFSNQDKGLKSFIKKFNQDKLPNGFLTNGEESVSFEKKLFNKIRESISCKIDFIISLLNSENNKSTLYYTKQDNTVINLEDQNLWELIKKFNVKSWGILIAIAIVIFSGGMFLNRILNSKEKNNLIEENTGYKETIELLNKENLKRNIFIIDSVTNVYSKKIELKKEEYDHKLDSILKNRNE